MAPVIETLARVTHQPRSDDRLLYCTKNYPPKRILHEAWQRKNDAGSKTHVSLLFELHRTLLKPAFNVRM